MSLKMCFTRSLAASKQSSVLRMLTSNFHTTSTWLRGEDRKEMIKSMPKKDEGTEGEKAILLDNLIQKT